MSEEVNRLASLLAERLPEGAVSPSDPADALPLAEAPPADGPALAPPAETIAESLPSIVVEAAFAGAPSEGGRAPTTPVNAQVDSLLRRRIALPPGGSLAGCVEAVLLVANEPMSTAEILKIVEGVSRSELLKALDELRESYRARPAGIELLEIAGGWRLLTRPEYAPWVERLEKVRREERLSKAQLEVLAVIAYRQPMLRADVDSVRGADSGGALRGLLDKGFVKVVGRADQAGRPLLYGTTDRFLERFTLKSLKELPRPKSEA